MADLSDIVAQSISSAREEGTIPESEETPIPESTEGESDTTETVEETHEEAGETTEETPEEKVEEKKPAGEDDDPELTKLLEENGFKRPSKGQKENRIPYPRVRKIIGNALKKAQEKFTKDLTDRDGKLSTYEKEMQAYKSVDNLIATDPGRYVQMLAALHPTLYGRYLTPAEAKKEAAAVAAVPDAKDDQKPGPDIKYEDGSVAYSPEQHDKLLEWNRRQATRDIKAELDKELKPVRDQRKAEEFHQEQAKRIEAEVKDLREVWGQLFVDEEAAAKTGKSEILAFMKANPGVSLTKATGIVLTKKMTADRTRMRKEIIAELKVEPKNKPSTTPSARKTVETSEPQSLESIVAAQFRKAQGG